MSGLLGDLKLSLRQLTTQRGHSAVVIATLGLALGLSAVIFSFVNFFLLKPLPVRDEKTLILARASHPQQGEARPRLSYGDFVDFKEQAKTVDHLAAMSFGTGALTGKGDAKRVFVSAASADLFAAWDLGVFAGRAFDAAEDTPGGAPVALLSHGFWEREFGGDRTIVGKTLTLDGRAVSVIGIVSPAIEIGTFAEIEVWIPIAQANLSLDRSRRDLRVTGRLKPGVTTAQASAEFATIALRLQKEHPDTNRDWTASAITLRQGLYGAEAGVILALLTVGVCLVFAVACANVAGIMLARATTREREMALRMSLGAAGSQITRQLMVEGAVLSFLGAGLGLVLAQAGLEFMRAVAFEQFYELVTIDVRVLAFSAALALVAPVLFGLAPALQLAGRELSNVLREAGAGAGTSGRVGRSRRGLVIMQIGLATALLIVSGLSVRTALVLRDYNFGFESSGLLTARIDLAETRFKTDEQVRSQAEKILTSLQGLPRTSATALGTELPIFDRSRQVMFKTRDTSVDESRIATLTVATPGLFKALGMKVLRGRDFLETDIPQAPAVAVVNEALVAREFSGRDPIGERIQVGGGDTPWLEVVGVASNLVNPGSGELPTPRAYVAMAQRPQRSLVVFARTESPEPILASLRETMRSIDPDQPIYDAKTMEQVIWEDLASNRIITGLFMALGLVSLTLAAVGLYGLNAFLVAQRSREIGVRMALGASARDVVRMVISQGARLTAAGLAVGVTLGLLLGRAMSSILIEVSPSDPTTVLTTLGVLGFAAVIAHWVPARRAAMVNPIDALRHD